MSSLGKKLIFSAKEAINKLKESTMNEFNLNTTLAPATPVLTDADLEKLLETKPSDTVGFVTTDDFDDEAPTTETIH